MQVVYVGVSTRFLPINVYVVVHTRFLPINDVRHLQLHISNTKLNTILHRERPAEFGLVKWELSKIKKNLDDRATQISKTIRYLKDLRALVVDHNVNKGKHVETKKQIAEVEADIERFQQELSGQSRLGKRRRRSGKPPQIC